MGIITGPCDGSPIGSDLQRAAKLAFNEIIAVTDGGLFNCAELPATLEFQRLIERSRPGSWPIPSALSVPRPTIETGLFMLAPPILWASAWMQDHAWCCRFISDAHAESIGVAFADLGYAVSGHIAAIHRLNAGETAIDWPDVEAAAAQAMLTLARAGVAISLIDPAPPLGDHSSLATITEKRMPRQPQAILRALRLSPHQQAIQRAVSDISARFPGVSDLAGPVAALASPWPDGLARLGVQVAAISAPFRALLNPHR
jgi:hypothetical protein